MPNDVVSRAIDAVCAGENLTADHASTVLSEIMEGRTEPIQTGAFLIALRAKGETVSELVGLARTMRSLAAPVQRRAPRPGRHRRAPAAARRPSTSRPPPPWSPPRRAAPVAKHGNRSATSKSGSADVLEALGVDVDLDPEAVGRCIDEVGFGFMFAPRHHSAMAHVGPARAGLGVRTVFNFLGPLTNPAGRDPAAGRRRRPPLPGDDRRGADRARRRAGAGRERRGRARRARALGPDPGDRGLRGPHRRVVRRARPVRPRAGRAEPEIAGGTPAENAAVTRAVLAGESGPGRDIVLLNAAAAIYVGGLAADLEDGVGKAAAAVDSGAAADVLDKLIAATVAAAG